MKLEGRTIFLLNSSALASPLVRASANPLTVVDQCCDKITAAILDIDMPSVIT